jgi:uncharacterized protein DUF6909
MEEILGISKAIRDFDIYVRHGVINGKIRIYDLLDVFREIRPALHQYAAEDRIIDVEALGYSTKRLPNNIYSINTILIKRSVPENFGRFEGITEVPSDVKRRDTYQISDSEIIMVTREDVTDILDLVTLLCSFVIEANKVKEKIIASGLVDELEETTPAQVEMPGFTISHDSGMSQARKNQLFTKLAFELGISEEEILELDHGWHGKLLNKMYQIAKYDHDMTIKIHSSITAANMDNRAREWVEDISQALSELELSDRPIHIASSNTHSYVNCLSGFCREKRYEIELNRLLEDPKNSEFVEDAQRIEGDRTDNLKYQVLRAYLGADPRRKKTFEDYQKSEGINFLADRRHTGIPVQIIDVGKMDPDKLDPRIRVDKDYVSQEKPVIINFEYAFGEQADKIIGALCEEFNKRIRSVTIMGKAGTLIGGRGCIMIPSYFLNDGKLDVYDLFVPNGVSKKDMQDIVPIDVYADGPMLTVLGTILQNTEMLLFFARRWGVLGLEMEGVPYIKKLKQCHKLGYFRDSLQLYIAYYASDNPTRKGETLARGLGYEGLVATYGITIGVLSKIFTPPTNNGSEADDGAVEKDATKGAVRRERRVRASAKANPAAAESEVSEVTT